MTLARKRMLLVATMSVLLSGPALAQTLQDSLVAAYENNPTLNAQRARLRAADEQVPQALSGFRPTVQAFSNVGRQWIDGNKDSLVGAENDALWQQTYGASVEQPLYRGGRTAASLRSAEHTVLAERARLESREQVVLLDAATSYSDVYRDQATLELTIRNEQRLTRQLEAARDRFQVGEVTRTDVFQAEARLAQATADRIQAEGNLEASRAAFRNVVGIVPGVLVRPALPDGLPVNLDDATGSAIDTNPNVVASAWDERRTLDDVDNVRGELLPEVSLIGRVQRDLQVVRRDSRTDTAEALVSVQIPLYQAGSVYSRLRESKQVVTQARRLLDQSQRDAVEDATRSWNALETAHAQIGALQKQVDANRVALEGVEKEAEVGARTVLDVLNAEQELVNSQVDLVRAERNEVVAAYQLKSSVGDLTARRVGLPVDLYDPTQHYDAVRGLWFGGSSIGDDSSDFRRTRQIGAGQAPANGWTNAGSTNK